MQNKALDYVTSCLLFLAVIVAVCLNFEMLLTDADTAWHLAAGDLIRKTGAIPQTDPWAYTSAGVPWINVAWLWDVWMSYLHEAFGWHGKIAFLAIIEAPTMVLLYNACLIRTGNGIASFFSVLFVLISISLFLRSMWVSNLFLALIFLLALLVEYRQWSVRWWYVLPALMPLWVNVHGGFIVAFVIPGVFGLQALLRSNWRLFFHLTLAVILSVVAMGFNPYGYKGVADVVIKTLTTPALEFIGEFQPSTFSWSFLLTHLYIPVFLFCAMHRKVQTSVAEALLGFGFLLLAVTSQRYWTFVYLFSCPILAQYFTGYMRKQETRGHPAIMRMAERLKDFFLLKHAGASCMASSLVVVAAAIFLFTPSVERMMGLKNYQPYEDFAPAVKFVQKHYPNHRFFTDYTSGGPFIYVSGGTFPIFIDGRGETAYPQEVIKDYARIISADRHWEAILDKYGMDGVMLVNLEKVPNLPPRFEKRRGWRKVFEDKTEVVYIRE